MLSQIDLAYDAEKRYVLNKKEIKNHQRKIKNNDPLASFNIEEILKKRIQRLGPDPNIGLEKLIGKNNLLPINYLTRGLQVARTVCRIVSRATFGIDQAIGTGFMVSPNLMLTNNHVLPDVEAAEFTKAQFNYTINFNGNLSSPISFKLRPDLLFITDDKDELDFTLVAISQENEMNIALGDFGWNKLIAQTGKVINGEELTIIQHPNGEPKQIALRENTLLARDENFLFYETDTNPGSSGSPVFNNQWEIVALHHSGVPDRDKNGHILTIYGEKWHRSMGDHKIKWISNEGIRISKIIEFIEKQKLLSSTENKLVGELFNIDSYYAPLEFHLDKILSSENILSEPHKEVGLKDKNVKEPKHIGTISEHTYEFYCHKSKMIQDTAIELINEKFNATPEPLFQNNEANNETLKRYYLIKIRSVKSPWKVAQELEAIEGVFEVDPDLDSMTWCEPIFENDLKGIESLSFRKGSNRRYIEKKYKGIHPTWNHDVTNFRNAVIFSQTAGRLNGMTGIKVAQLDTGYSGHQEIANINMSAGFDYVDGDDDARDHFGGGLLPQPGHGTRTAAIIAGVKTNNPEDLNDGLFPYVNFVPFRVSNSVAIMGRAKCVSQAVHDAIRKNFDIITMSMGSYGRSSWKKLARLAYENGVFWICAAGNHVRFVIRPAAYPGTIAVAASNYKNEIWNGSSCGKRVDVTAPGECIYVPRSDFEGDKIYSYGSGTSYATPHIAASVALWLNHHHDEINDKYEEPWQRIEAFKYCISRSVQVPKGWDNSMFGKGILNSEALLDFALPDTSILSHAYYKGFKETGDEKLSLAQKELLYHYWNAQDPSSGSILLEKNNSQTLTKEAVKLKMNISKESFLVEEYNFSQNRIESYLNQILEDPNY